MSATIAKSLEEAIERLRRDPVHPVEAVVDDLRIEVRVKPLRSAADLFREVGSWEGESTEELWQRLAEERQRGGSGEPPAL
jgi:hypothetical protein